MDKFTKPELYGKVLELEYELELAKKQLILITKNNEQKQNN